ncbi:leucine-rich repeat receptor-like protein kinase PEPR1 [Dioscorea cayenensis subsp. rotundata]|uniref:Leucine-rich repeat receptor-like protein kinase PEPR1 n=1 Tax=Dioscorea cayennensis subsp. rotundata TaxID=55577 RepID=A0AB40ASA4_DIOCR|nr:leucine-rich repeat receptor-like protein kinase PEPR1 [Dioscorea cayenensis subsp. rotundata]
MTGSSLGILLYIEAVFGMGSDLFYCFSLFLFSIPISFGLCPDGQALLALSKNLVLPSSIKSSWNSSDPNPCDWWNDSGFLVSEWAFGDSLSEPEQTHRADPRQHRKVVQSPNTFGYLKISCQGRIPLSSSSLRAAANVHIVQSFQGEIPAWLGNCSNLTVFAVVGQSAYENQLEGIIPRELGQLSNLKTLRLFTNYFTGEFPVEIWRIKSLEEVLVYNNSLSGLLSPVMTELRNLKNVTLFNNRFSGVIPQGLGINSSLVQIDFTNNNFVGGIPPNICHGKQLEVLNLGYNLLEGNVPADVGNCSSLRRLILRNNKLSGSLPDFAEDSSLLYMDLRENNLNGPLPPSVVPLSLKNLLLLSQLMLQGNQFSGGIPDFLSGFEMLLECSLIPSEFANLNRLQTLDVSNNNLTGELTSLRDLSSLLQVNVSYNQFTGSFAEKFVKLVGFLSKLISRAMQAFVVRR